MNKFDYNDWYYLILHEISRRKKVKIFKNVQTQISVNSNRPFRGLLCEMQGAGLHVS